MNHDKDAVMRTSPKDPTETESMVSSYSAGKPARLRSHSLLAASALIILTLFLSPTSAGATTVYSSLSFVDSEHGWLVGEYASGGYNEPVISLIWKTDDGGISWHELARHSDWLGVGPAVAFSSLSIGLWADVEGLSTTLDGGRSFLPASTIDYCTGLDFASAEVAWAVTTIGSDESGGAVWRTGDGGTTWRMRKSVQFSTAGSGGFQGVSAPDPKRCCVLGIGKLGGVWVTTDGGFHWGRRVLPRIAGSNTNFRDIDFPTGSVGWAVGDRGTIEKTTSAGREWTKQWSGVSVRLLDVEFTSARCGFAVGERGVILHTEDGGRHWRRQVALSSRDAWAVDFVDNRHGWVIVGGDLYGLFHASPFNGSILRTADGGKTWHTCAAPDGSFIQ